MDLIGQEARDSPISSDDQAFLNNFPYRSLLGEVLYLSMPLSEPTPFILGSQSAQDLATNPVYHKRSKHVEIRYHWVREHVNPDASTEQRRCPTWTVGRHVHEIVVSTKA